MKKLSRPLKLKVHEFLKDYFNLYVRFQHKRGFNRFAKNYFDDGDGLTGVEIGVAKGQNAEEILETLPVETLYLVDPYDGQGDYWSEGVHPSETLVHTETRSAFEKAKDRLDKYSGRVEWVHKTSMEALNEIPDNLDFVYVDGNHEYKYVGKDIWHYWDKVKEGGLLGGHDLQLPGVTEAVWEFSQEINQTPIVMSKATQYTDWIFIKEGNK